MACRCRLGLNHSRRRSMVAIKISFSFFISATRLSVAQYPSHSYNVKTLPNHIAQVPSEVSVPRAIPKSQCLPIFEGVLCTSFFYELTSDKNIALDAQCPPIPRPLNPKMVFQPTRTSLERDGAIYLILLCQFDYHLVPHNCHLTVYGILTAYLSEFSILQQVMTRQCLQ